MADWATDWVADGMADGMADGTADVVVHVADGSKCIIQYVTSAILMIIVLLTLRMGHYIFIGTNVSSGQRTTARRICSSIESEPEHTGGLELQDLYAPECTPEKEHIGYRLRGGMKDGRSNTPWSPPGRTSAQCVSFLGKAMETSLCGSIVYTVAGEK